jgi:SulP family sulfate permease
MVIDLLRRASLPFTTLLHESTPGSYFISGGEGSVLATPGLIVYRFTAPLYFANANLFSEEIQKLVTQAPTPVKWFVLDSSAIHDMDTTGAGTLRQVLHAGGTRCHFCHHPGNNTIDVRFERRRTAR